MTEESGSTDGPRWLTDEFTLEWLDEHAADLRASLSGQRILYSSLILGFLVGLAAHVAGYLLQSSHSRGISGLLGDLLYALGWSLWTGVVVIVFVQVIPEVKRRQIQRALDAYEALKRNQAPGAGESGDRRK